MPCASLALEASLGSLGISILLCILPPWLRRRGAPDSTGGTCGISGKLVFDFRSILPASVGSSWGFFACKTQPRRQMPRPGGFRMRQLPTQQGDNHGGQANGATAEPMSYPPMLWNWPVVEEKGSLRQRPIQRRMQRPWQRQLQRPFQTPLLHRSTAGAGWSMPAQATRAPTAASLLRRRRSCTHSGNTEPFGKPCFHKHCRT